MQNDEYSISPERKQLVLDKLEEAKAQEIQDQEEKRKALSAAIRKLQNLYDAENTKVKIQEHEQQRQKELEQQKELLMRKREELLKKEAELLQFKQTTTTTATYNQAISLQDIFNKFNQWWGIDKGASVRLQDCINSPNKPIFPKSTGKTITKSEPKEVKIEVAQSNADSSSPVPPKGISYDDLTLCSSCMKNPINCIFMHCKHATLCTSCAESTTECPVCYEHIQQVIVLAAAKL